MGLNGRLEDLPLLDIVQVVTYSQKTGYLTVETPEGEAAIVFERGLVVGSFTPDTKPLDVGAAGGTPEERAPVIRRRIESALERLIRLREGGFIFSLTPAVPTAVGGRDIRGETLENGIKSEELLLDLARGMDEDRRDAAAALESGFAGAAEEVTPRDDGAGAATETAAGPEGPAAAATDVGGEEPPPGEAEAGEPLLDLTPLPEDQGEGRHRVVLLVDDEADVRTLMAGVFIEGGYQVVEAGSPAGAARAARSLQDLGLPFVLVVDRGMPTSDHSSFDGGLEVVRRLKQAGHEAPALLMTDRLTRPVQDKARKLGVAKFVFKPSLSRLDPDQFEADMRAFAQQLCETALPRLEAAVLLPTESTPVTSLPQTEEAWREAAELQQRLDDLRRPQDAAQVSALVMNMARDYFERAVLFILKDDELRGLGGFGPAAHDDIILVIREARVPLSEPSVFREVAASGQAHVGPLPPGRYEALLTDAIGLYAAREAAILPLVTNRQAIALLYGDNPLTGSAMRPLEGLLVFLAQAGIALENAFLRRHRDSRASRPGSAPGTRGG